MGKLNISSSKVEQMEKRKEKRAEERKSSPNTQSRYREMIEKKRLIFPSPAIAVRPVFSTSPATPLSGSGIKNRMWGEVWIWCLENIFLNHCRFSFSVLQLVILALKSTFHYFCRHCITSSSPTPVTSCEPDSSQNGGGTSFSWIAFMLTFERTNSHLLNKPKFSTVITEAYRSQEICLILCETQLWFIGV